MYFIYFYCVNAKFRLSNIVSNKSGENVHPFVVHDLRRKTLLIFMIFTIELFCSFLKNKRILSAPGKPLAFLLCWVLQSRNVAAVGQMLLPVSTGSSRVFFLLFTYYGQHIINFYMLKLPAFKNKSYSVPLWHTWYNPFYIFLYLGSQYFVQDIFIMFIRDSVLYCFFSHDVFVLAWEEYWPHWISWELFTSIILLEEFVKHWY